MIKVNDLWFVHDKSDFLIILNPKKILYVASL